MPRAPASPAAPRPPAQGPGPSPQPLGKDLGHVPAREILDVDPQALEPSPYPASHPPRDRLVGDADRDVIAEQQAGEELRVDGVMHRLEPRLADELVQDVGLGGVAIRASQGGRVTYPQTAIRGIRC